MTAEKARKMLLEDKQRLKEDFIASILVTHSHLYQNTETANC